MFLHGVLAWDSFQLKPGRAIMSKTLRRNILRDACDHLTGIERVGHRHVAVEHVYNRGREPMSQHTSVSHLRIVTVMGQVGRIVVVFHTNNNKTSAPTMLRHMTPIIDLSEFKNIMR